MKMILCAILCAIPLSLFAAVRGALLTRGLPSVPLRILAVYLCFDFLLTEQIGGPEEFFSGSTVLLLPLLFALSAFAPVSSGGVASLTGVRVAARSLLGPFAPARILYAAIGLGILRPELPSADVNAFSAIVGLVVLREAYNLSMVLRLVCALAPVLHAKLSPTKPGQEMLPVPSAIHFVDDENEDDLFRGIEDLKSFED